jgi:hypothetical protein
MRTLGDDLPVGNAWVGDAKVFGLEKRYGQAAHGVGSRRSNDGR